MGRINDESFAVPLLYPNQAKIDELRVKTLRKEATRSTTEDEKGQYIVDNSLHSLWHGEVKKELPLVAADSKSPKSH